MIEEIKKLKIGKIIVDPKMKDYTTYKVGGEALAIVYPTDIDNLIKLIKFLRSKNIKYKVIGNGSNLIFSEKGYEGIIIKLTEFDDLEIKGNVVRVSSGYNLVKLCLKVAKQDLTGLEFASGIPGTIGGAVFMNAGAYNSDMGYVVGKIKVLTPDLEIKTIFNKDLAFHYRTSFLQKNPNYICLEATIYLKKGLSENILQVIHERRERRMISQPLEFPSAGSVFRNPKDDFAGRLIEELGYKGNGIGDAIVSEKHANFIINKGKATGDDVKKLILEIKDKVKEKYNIDLIVEQEFVE